MDVNLDDARDALRLAERRVRRLEHIVRVQRVAITATVMLLVVILLASVFSRQQQYARAIIIDGELCCLVAGQKEAEAVRQQMIAAARGDLSCEACIEQKWEDTAVAVDDRPVLSVNEAIKSLSSRVTVKVEAATILVEGVAVAALPSADLAQKALDTLKSQYVGDQGGTVVSQRLQPEPVVSAAGVKPQEILTDIRQVVQLLSQSRGEPRTYTVKAGDFPEKIAKSNNMTVDEFHRLNPGLRSKTMHPGDKVNVGPAAPPITVVTVLEITKEEPTQPPVDRQYSPSLKRGEQQVSSEGKPGVRKTTYRITKHNDVQVSSETVTEQVVDAGEPKRLLIGTGDAG